MNLLTVINLAQKYLSEVAAETQQKVVFKIYEPGQEPDILDLPPADGTTEFIIYKTSSEFPPAAHTDHE